MIYMNSVKQFRIKEVINKIHGGTYRLVVKPWRSLLRCAVWIVWNDSPDYLGNPAFPMDILNVNTSAEEVRPMFSSDSVSVCVQNTGRLKCST